MGEEEPCDGWFGCLQFPFELFTLLSLLGEKNLWFIHCISSVLANFLKIASLDLFSKAREIEMAPDIRKVTREKGCERLSLSEGRLYVAFERSFCSVVRCTQHPNFLEKWELFGNVTIFVT